MFNNKIHISLYDTGDGLSVSPDFIRKHVRYDDEGYAVLDYEDGEPLRLVEAFDSIMIATAKIENKR